MQINIHGVGITVTDSLKDYVNDKFKRLERKGDLITSISVTLTVEKLAHIAKADLAVVGNNLHAEAEAESMYPAIDALIDKVDGQLVKYKDSDPGTIIYISGNESSLILEAQGASDEYPARFSVFLDLAYGVSSKEECGR